MTKEHEIKAVLDPAIGGYAHAFVAIKPWKVFVDQQPLLDKGGRPRRFASEHAALAAARRSIG